MPQCSIIIPVYGKASLTLQCLNALLAYPSERVDFEIIVVDDASTDMTPRLLAEYADRIRVVTHTTNTGFATACNDGVAVASGQHLVFLNNDTVPQAGWLEALVSYAERNPRAAAIGSKLLFPDNTIQHAGVVVCQDLVPRHIYAGFPSDHPAVNKSRRFQIVTAACVLIRQNAFEQMGGFDTAFRNSCEDADLCLRLGEAGHEVHYCHESVLYHLESVSDGRFKHTTDNTRLYHRRWAQRVQPDDIHYYLEDGLLKVNYTGSYPIHLAVSPLLAAVADGKERGQQADQLLGMRSRQVFDLLREIIRLTVHVGEMNLRTSSQEPTTGQHGNQEITKVGGADQYVTLKLQQTIKEQTEHANTLITADYLTDGESDLRAMLLDVHEQLLQRDDKLQAAIYDFQASLSTAIQCGGAHAVAESFTPSSQLLYQPFIHQMKEVVRATLPPDAIVLVVSRGDPELLKLDGRRAQHFPQIEDGVYAGHYPADSREAITHLESLRARGAEYLLFPPTAFWWLEHYVELKRHLDDRYRVVVRQEDACLIFALRPPEIERRAL